MKDGRSFLILGLPRTRTAWLSCLLSHGEVYCHHDLTSRCKTAMEVVRSVMFGPGRVCGNSDSGNLFVLERFLEVLPETRLIWLHREPEQVIESMARVTGEKYAKLRGPIERLHARNQQFRARFGGAVFGWDELDNEEAVRGIWRLITGGMEFPFEHWRKMTTMRVTIHDDIMARAIAGRHECADSEITQYASTILAG